MKTIITIIAENSISRPGLLGEHGFGAMIERGDEKYLFDTGPQMSWPLNLKALNKDLTGLSQIILSHGHYDHTGGLPQAVRLAGPVEIVAHPEIFGPHHVIDAANPDNPPRYAGIPATRPELENLGAYFRFIDHTEEISPGIFFITGINRAPDQLPNDRQLVMLKDGRLTPDPIIDDASLLLRCDCGDVLLLGCAHSGVLNILDHLRNNLGITRLAAILGGTHLMFSDSEFVPRVIARFAEFSIELIGVSHCTGWPAALALAKHFDSRFTMAAAGAVFTF
ncbi:MAG: MBL fold metallo-hydrolase [Deltaproteobacteria bacterium]|nr:MBL fold metallo-hydrolase [Deltaproteobacteria bacterium]